MSATDLYDLCNDYLEACAAAVEVTPGGPIANRYVSPGVPAADCEQLTVHAGGPSEGDTAPLQPPLQPGHRSQLGAAVILIAMTATVYRCVPSTQADGRPPLAVDLDDAGRKITADVWAIWNYIRWAYSKKQLFTRDDGVQRELFFEPAVVLNTMGGVAGWQIPIRVQLGGYGFDG